MCDPFYSRVFDVVLWGVVVFIFALAVQDIVGLLIGGYSWLESLTTVIERK